MINGVYGVPLKCGLKMHQSPPLLKANAELTGERIMSEENRWCDECGFHGDACICDEVSESKFNDLLDCKCGASAKVWLDKDERISRCVALEHGCGLIKEGKLTEYNWIIQHSSNLKLGYKTDIGAFTYINAKFGVTIEDFVEIGSHCSIYSVSTIDNKKGQVTLKKKCKIGSHSVVMPGITVGENSVIGAFSFINEDIPDNVIAAGIPLKIIKKIK